MSDLEKLTAIRARCVELLAIAGKRTPGKWTHEMQCDSVWSDHYFDLQIAHTESKPGAGMVWDADQRRNNATFIASCAGAAEAGWRATIAAIDGLTLTCEGFKFPDEDRPDAWRAIQEILTAWEGLV